jgi:ElaB/YqjD/DUF883 family membrane-anchored ribosome-binding protein
MNDSTDVSKGKLAADMKIVIADAEELLRATDDYVHEHPWGAVGIAAAMGLVLGMLISRR